MEAGSGSIHNLLCPSLLSLIALDGGRVGWESGGGWEVVGCHSLSRELTGSAGLAGQWAFGICLSLGMCGYTQLLM